MTMILSTVELECCVSGHGKSLTIIVVCCKVREEAREQALDTLYRMIDELNLATKPGFLSLIEQFVQTPILGTCHEYSPIWHPNN